MPSPSAVDLIRFLLRAKWVILVVSAVVGVGAYLYSRTLPEYFKATINCVPASSDAGLLGGSSSIGSALKDIGLSKLSPSGGPQYEFMVVIESRQIRDSMIRQFDLVTDYDMASKPMDKVRDAFDDNLEVNLRAEGNYEITIWSKAAQQSVEMCNAFVAYANRVANSIQRQDATKTTQYLTRRIEAIDSIMSSLTDSLGKYSGKYLMFDPTSQAEASAKALIDVRTTLLQQQAILSLLQTSYGDKDPQVMAQRTVVAQLEQQFSDLTNKPGYVGDFSIRDAAGIGAGYMRLLTEFEAHAKLKAFLLPTLEQARLDQQKSTPSLLVVDNPVIIEKKDRPKRLLIAAGSAVGCAILMISMMLLWRAWRDTFKQPTSA